MNVITCNSSNHGTPHNRPPVASIRSQSCSRDRSDAFLCNDGVGCGPTFRVSDLLSTGVVVCLFVFYEALVHIHPIGPVLQSPLEADEQGRRRLHRSEIKRPECNPRTLVNNTISCMQFYLTVRAYYFFTVRVIYIIGSINLKVTIILLYFLYETINGSSHVF